MPYLLLDVPERVLLREGGSFADQIERIHVIAFRFSTPYFLKFYGFSVQIFSFVQSSREVLRHALIRSHFLLKLTNQVPSLCLLPRFAAKFRLFLTVLTTIPKIALHTRLCRFSSKFQREKILHTPAISVFGITMRSLKLADSWHFETHCGHFA